MDTSETCKGRTLEEAEDEEAPGQEISAIAFLRLKSIRERGSEGRPGI